MMRFLPSVLLVLAAACGGGSSPDGSGEGGNDGDGETFAPDVPCTDGGPAVTLSCPEAVDLGCVPATGAPVTFNPIATSCRGAPAVTCVPPSGSVVTPGGTLVTCRATIPTGESAACEFEIRALPAGGFEMTCVPEVGAACAGSATPVAVPEPAVEAACGSPTGPIVNDAPAGGFPPGETTVTFTGTGEGGFTASCTTEVTVTDDAPPVLACPPSVTAVRTDPTADAPVPPLAASDACDGAIPATASPARLPRGTFPVTYAATDAAGRRAECTTSVTVLDAFPVTGLRIVSARLDTAGTTSAVAAWDPTSGIDATGYRVERAPAPEGPWTPLETVGLDTLYVTDPALPGTVAYYRVVTLAGGIDGGAAPAVRAYAIQGARYDLRDRTVPTVPFPTTLYGVVRHPVDLAAGPFPLILLLHGNHGNCRPVPFESDDECAETTDHDCPWSGYTTTPNAEGMLFQAETLAAHGYVAATLSGNALNCRDDYIPERTELLLEHLRRWAGWATAGGEPFGATFVGAVDLGRVGLVGHSRGGEAVALVPARIAATPVAGVRLGSVFSIAPTDYHDPDPAAVPYAVLIPACDGDVYTLEGMNIYDRALDSSADTVRSQVFFAAANHNYFSTEWRWDDNGWSPIGAVCWTWDEIGARAQQGMLEATEAAWFDGTLAAGGAPEAFLRADAPTPAGIAAWAGSAIDLRWSHASAGRLLIDDLEGAGAPDVNLLGQPNEFTGDWYVARACYQNDCDRSFDHEKTAMFLSWEGTTPLATWHLGALDASSYPYFSFRVTSRRSTLNTGIAEQEFGIRLVDADGTAVDLLLSDVTRVPHLYASNFQREMLQTVRVPLAEIAAWTPGFEPGALSRLELQVGVAGRVNGSFLVTDIELAR